MFTAEQSEDIHHSRLTLGEIKEAVKALKGKKSPGVDQLVAVAYQHLEAPELDGLAGRVTEVLRTVRAPSGMGGARCGPCTRRGITSGRRTGDQYAVPSQRPSWSGW